MEKIELTAGPDASGRLDAWLAGQCAELSRSALQNLMEQGRVTRGGSCVNKKDKVVPGAAYCIDLPEPQPIEAQPQNIPLDVVYEDNDLIVINKPKGMVVHPAAGHYSGTLVNALLYHCKDLSGINGVMRPGIVHRIDKDTTGSLIACKNDFAHNSIAEQLKEHSIVRKYRAICFGSLKEEEGTVDKPIGRDPNNRKKMAVVPNGKHAVTHYRVLEHFNGYTYIECILETGRTHQIRVHMASIGHPLLGDEVYSNRKAPFHLEGQTLHAMTLGFKHPHTGEYIETNAPLPDYFVHLLQILHQ